MHGDGVIKHRLTNKSMHVHRQEELVGRFCNEWDANEKMFPLFCRAQHRQQIDMRKDTRIPGDCVVIMEGEGGTWYGFGGDVRGGYTPLPGGCVWVWGMKVSSMLIGDGGLSSSLTERLRASWLLSTNMFKNVCGK